VPKEKSSSFAAAFFAFVLLNIGLEVCCVKTKIEYSYLPLIQNQQVMSVLTKGSFGGLVFLGSSIIEVPLALLDHRHYYEAISQYGEKEFSSALNEKITVRDFSIEAALISDQYLMLRRIAGSNPRSRCIILGVAPRDFYDTRWPHRSQTCGFRTLAGFSDMALWSKYLDNPVQWADFILYKTVRPTLTSAVSSWSHLMASRLWSFGSSGGAQPEVISGGSLDRATDERGTRIRASLEEYQKCYQGIEKGNCYQQQVSFLRSLLGFAAQQKLNLVLVNMPITAGNRRLLPEGFYEHFRQDISGCAKEVPASYLDLSEDGSFTDDDFYDSAHLGEAGGKKLIERLLPMVKPLPGIGQPK
jgi:hypothetical protein